MDRKCPQLFQAQRQIITKILIKNGEFIIGISINFDLYFLVYFLYIKFYSSICKTREKPICTKSDPEKLLIQNSTHL